jgi:hypothetical protein
MPPSGRAKRISVYAVTTGPPTAETPAYAEVSSDASEPALAGLSAGFFKTPRAPKRLIAAFDTPPMAKSVVVFERLKGGGVKNKAATAAHNSSVSSKIPLGLMALT